MTACLPIWLKTSPKVTRKHRATLELFRTYFKGRPVDYRAVTPEHCWGFLEMLDREGASLTVQRKHWTTCGARSGPPGSTCEPIPRRASTRSAR